MAPKRKKFCKHGHDLDEYAKYDYHTTLAGNKTIRRFCGECHRIRVQKSKSKNRKRD